MSRKLDQILFVDVEATCWDGPRPEGEESRSRRPGMLLH